MSAETAKLASACEVAARVILGAAKPTKSEKAYIVERLREAAIELRARQ